MNPLISASVGLLLAVMPTRPVITSPTTIKVLTTRAIATVLNKTGAEFERTTGYKLDITSDIAIRMVRRIQAGESFDILVASPEQIDALTKEGKITAGTRTNLARSGIGVEVRAGAPKPDISSVGAFKRALLKAKSVAYLKEGQSGVYLAALIKRLGLADALKSKVVRPDTDTVSELVAKGEVELGLVVITQILTTHGVELAGPLPPEIQSYVVFAAGVSTDSRAPAAAKELIEFLTAHRAKRVMRLQGMETWSDIPR
ncbi:MAG: substrate-binding domain-containing protein [Acidobacteria bacterium]|nr:substrate-binding domain-containing protein [Acidobacteriota bacterium]